MKYHTIIIITIILMSLVFPLNCSAQPEHLTPKQISLLENVNESLSRAAAFLISSQSPDGAWRSQTYGMFKDGMTLTPFVMSALFFLDNVIDDANARAAFRKGTDYLIGKIDRDGKIQAGPHGFLFPVLTAASAIRMVVLETKDEAHRQIQNAYMGVIREWQLTETLGWTPDDSEYGGWGFSLMPPQKNKPGELRERFAESNMVATIFAIAALRSARIPLSEPIWSKALVFVKRCQNFSDDPARADKHYDDGGFFFIPGDPLQNKAGIAGTDKSGRQRFHSYGTMTADGIRALLQCGLAPEHPRVKAARKWLDRHFSAEKNPGTFNPDREVLRNATYYYWAWAISHGFSRMGTREITQNGKKIRWAEVLAQAMLSRQKSDGTWANHFTDAREDDPLIATSWAASTLAICRQAMLVPDDEDFSRCASGKPE